MTLSAPPLPTDGKKEMQLLFLSCTKKKKKYDDDDVLTKSFDSDHSVFKRLLKYSVPFVPCPPLLLLFFIFIFFFVVAACYISRISHIASPTNCISLSAFGSSVL